MPSIPGVARYAADYERLRERMPGTREPATSGPEMPGIGLGLVLEAGLPAWVQAITDALGAAAPTNGPVLREASPVVTPPLTSDATGGGSLLRDVALSTSDLVAAVRPIDVARLLANLVLSTRLPPRGGHCGVSPGGRPSHPDPGACRC